MIINISTKNPFKNIIYLFKAKYSASLYATAPRFHKREAPQFHKREAPQFP